MNLTKIEADMLNLTNVNGCEMSKENDFDLETLLITTGVAIVVTILTNIIKFYLDKSNNKKKIELEKSKIFATKYFEYEIEKTKEALDCIKSTQEIFIEFQTLELFFRADRKVYFDSMVGHLLRNINYIKANFDFQFEEEQKKNLGYLFDLLFACKYIDSPFRNEDIMKKFKDGTIEDKQKVTYENLNEYDSKMSIVKDEQSLTKFSKYFNLMLKEKLNTEN